MFNRTRLVVTVLCTSASKAKIMTGGKSGKEVHNSSAARRCVTVSVMNQTGSIPSSVNKNCNGMKERVILVPEGMCYETCMVTTELCNNIIKAKRISGKNLER